MFQNCTSNFRKSSKIQKLSHRNCSKCVVLTTCCLLKKCSILLSKQLYFVGTSRMAVLEALKNIVIKNIGSLHIRWKPGHTVQTKLFRSFSDGVTVDLGEYLYQPIGGAVGDFCIHDAAIERLKIIQSLWNEKTKDPLPLHHPTYYLCSKLSLKSIFLTCALQLSFPTLIY